MVTNLSKAAQATPMSDHEPRWQRAFRGLVGAIVEIDPANGRRFWKRNSLPAAQFAERVINVRQMVGGHVFDEVADKLIVANAAIEPAQEKYKLNDSA